MLRLNRRSLLTLHLLSLFTFFTLFMVPSTLYAQVCGAGQVDLTFDPGAGANDSVFTVALQPDGKVIVGGDFTTFDDMMRVRIARLNTDGTVDTTFDPGTGANGTVSSAAVTPDGKIVIGGSFTTVNGVARNFIARLNDDGSVDATFDPGAGANGPVRTVSVQSDGKVIIGGDFTMVDGVARNRIARLNADGSLDTSFDPGAGANDTVLATAVQSDGSILIGGDFTMVDGTTRNRIARLNADGSLDTTFDPGTGASSTVRDIAIASDGTIVVVGRFSVFNGMTRTRIVRLNADGTVDMTFSANVNNDIFGVAISPEGKIVIGGNFTQVNAVARNLIARLNADGTLDTSFNTIEGANSTVRDVAVQPDAKVVIGGFFTSVSEIERIRVARLQGICTTADDLIIEGHVRDARGNALAGVNVRLSGTSQETIVTDAEGQYQFTVEAGGLYTVSVSHRNYTFRPATRNFGGSITTNQVADFTAVSKGRSFRIRPIRIQ